MIYTDTGPRTVVFADNGLPEVAEFLARPRLRPHEYSHAESVHDGLTFKDAMRVAREGWSEGAAMVHNLLTGLPFENNAQGVSHWAWDVAGEVPDVGRYASGEPAHMRRHTRRPGKERVIHIVVNTALSGFSSAQQQTNYGVGLCGLIDWLENTGRRVELDRLGVVEDSKLRSFQGWKVKRAADTMDLAAMAYALAHVSSHRHMVWGMRERCRNLVWRPKRITQADVALINAEGAFIIDSVLNDGDRCNTVASACLLAAERLNHASALIGGEELVDVEALRDALAQELAR